MAGGAWYGDWPDFHQRICVRVSEMASAALVTLAPGKARIIRPFITDRVIEPLSRDPHYLPEGASRWVDGPTNINLYSDAYSLRRYKLPIPQGQDSQPKGAGHDERPIAWMYYASGLIGPRQSQQQALFVLLDVGLAGPGGAEPPASFIARRLQIRKR